jgi:glutaredoxin
MRFGRSTEPPRFAMVTRAGCHLCDEMAAQLDAAGMEFESVDVDGDPELRARFGEVVPVLLRDGKPVAKVRVDAARLRRLVRRRR